MKPEKSVQLQLTGGSHKKDRRALDFYPTPPEATIALMNFLNLDIGRGTIVWEPASGDGSMSRVIERYVDRVISSDIMAGCYGIEADFFSTHFPEATAIITNPPFNTSEQFVRKAVGEARIVAMLLKSQYWHARKRFQLFDDHPPAWVLPLTWRPDFMGGEKGGAPTMEVGWTVWIEGQTETRWQPLLKPR